MDVQEEVERKAELVLAREVARTMFVKAMDAATSDAHPAQTTFPHVQRPEQQKSP